METLTFAFFYLAVPGLLFSVLRQMLSWTNKKAPPKPKFPEPKQYPIVGRIHDLPRFSMWLKFKEWADELGPIYQTNMVDQTFIIISDEKIAEELLVKRGHIYSGRPQIRSLFRHKEGPGYVALMDRHGKTTSWLPDEPRRRGLTRRTRRYLDAPAQMGSRRHGRVAPEPLLRPHRVRDAPTAGHVPT